jgi:predicted ATP-grasp superfamily ATP-dependent carboligase
LLQVAEKHDVDTIIPINDRALILLAPHHEVLGARLRLACPTPDQIASVLNKATTATIAAGLDIPVPVSIKCDSWADLEFLGGALKFPLIAKSRDKAETFCSSQIANPPLHRFDDYRTMRDTLEAQGGCARGLLLQEYCPGDDVGMAVLMHAGEARAVFQYRSRRTFPVDGGVCVLACTEQVDMRLADCVVRLLRAMSWEGVAQLDFRHDPATGHFALLEINGRFWGSAAVAIAAGLDFPHYVWQLAHGETPVIPETYKIGLLVRWLEGDVRRLLELRRQNRRRPVSLIREGLRLLAGFRPGVRDMFWSWSDPLPAFDTLADLARCWLVARWDRKAARMRLRPAAGSARAGLES